MFMNDKLDPDIATKLRDFLNRNPASMGEKTKCLRDGLAEQGCPLGMSFWRNGYGYRAKIVRFSGRINRTKIPRWLGRCCSYVYTGRADFDQCRTRSLVDATNVCIETGAILEAHKFNDPVTHSICVVRDDENSTFKILTPCGICQES